MDVDVEVVAHLLDEADVLAVELARTARQRPQVDAQILGAGFVKSVAARHVRQRGDQTFGLADQCRRVRRRFVGDKPPQRRIAGVGVDISGLDPVEAQTQQQVLADQAGGLHTG
ncbi:hypothetical protein MBRA_27200 [Mycobacterium branderi]|uniref:Uncharacterized protein n=1 Tax=Mycobacterium branderi TaxID=43348 RepID=A0ABM7KNB0_9MYCO|nr:hypothetical protein MBRA_27200 [Mycobacterium branderi]